MTDMPSPARLMLEPIGFVRTALESKAEAARQPPAASGTRGRIELLGGRNFEHALEDLAGWEFIWVLFWFHLNPGWRPKVLPPRSTGGRKGVFATRAPHRPNPIGLSAVRLERIDGLTLHIVDVDMVDGTPVLDLKPYVAYTDARPQARSGWLEDAAADPIAPYAVQLAPRAAEQADWIDAHTELKIRQRIHDTLALGPEPHPYRRIRPQGSAFQLAIKEWRVRFQVAGREIQVLEITSGYRASQLAAPAPDNATIALHRQFSDRYAHAAGADPQP